MPTNDCKVCTTCKQEKHVSEFYAFANGRLLGCCKECQKARSRNQVAVHRQVPVNYGECVVIDKLNSLSIPALPGKALGYRHADIVAWGCVLIECKLSKTIGEFHFTFGARQRITGLRAHITILCCEYDPTDITFHLFEAQDPVFYKKGKRKHGMCFLPVAHHRKSNPDVLTNEIMDKHQDDWKLIEMYRQNIAAQIGQGDKSLYEAWRAK